VADFDSLAMIIYHYEIGYSSILYFFLNFWISLSY